MRHHRYILLILTLAAGLLAILALTGCGSQQASSTGSTTACPANPHTVIPPTQGRPMVVEFFKPT